MGSQRVDESTRRDGMEGVESKRTNQKNRATVTFVGGRKTELGNLTLSFHSTTHFSIHGTRLITTNSRVNRAVCWMSFSSILRVFRIVVLPGLLGMLGVVGVVGCGDSDEGGGGRRGMRAGTGIGGGGSFGNASESK